MLPFATNPDPLSSSCMLSIAADADAQDRDVIALGSYEYGTCIALS
jgi:hypothetical protein